MSADRSWGADDLRRGIAAVGLRRGDQVVVHSSLRAIGGVDGGASTVVQSLIDVLGDEGTLVVPAFNYHADVEEVTDLAVSPARTGAIAEAARRHPVARRSDHPTHSVVALGAGADELVANHLRGRAMGPESPLGRLASGGGRVLLIGVGHTSNTMVHVAEESARVPKPSPSTGLPAVPVRRLDGRLSLHQLDTSPSCSAAFGAIEAPLRAASAISDGRLGSALCQLMTADDVIRVGKRFLEQRPDGLLCTWPECHPCQRTRAALAGGVRDSRAT